jgi:hypothetical protein
MSCGFVEWCFLALCNCEAIDSATDPAARCREPGPRRLPRAPSVRLAERQGSCAPVDSTDASRL